MDSYSTAVALVRKLTEAGHVAYFAGGWARDHIMGNDSDDIDIATDATPEQIMALFPKTIQVGIAFGVVIVCMNGHQYETATFRKDIEYINGRTPSKIVYSTPKEDALRRDFTINGMFFDPLQNEIYDYVGGEEDIRKGIVRTIGDAHDRFTEDRLRIIRAFRFAARFGFTIDPATEKAIIDNAHTIFPPIAMERVWQEFVKMAAYPGFDKALIAMQRCEVLPVIFHTLKAVPLADIEKEVRHFAHFPSITPAILFIIQLFPKASLKEMIFLCLHLKTSRQDIKYVESYFQAKSLAEEELKSPGFNHLVEWVALFADPNAIMCLEIIALQNEAPDMLVRCGQFRQHYLRHIERKQHRLPLVTGDTLKAEGISPGTHMGALMQAAERIAITHDLHDPKQVMEMLKQSPEWRSS